MDIYERDPYHQKTTTVNARRRTKFWWEKNTPKRKERQSGSLEEPSANRVEVKASYCRERPLGQTSYQKGQSYGQLYYWKDPQDKREKAAEPIQLREEGDNSGLKKHTASSYKTALSRMPSFLLLYSIMAFYGVSSQTCPNRTLYITCHITTVGVVTLWNIPQGNCPSNVIILSQSMGTDCGIKNESCGPFIGTNVAPPPGMDCTTSVLMVVATPQLNGANVSCYSGGVLQYQQNILIETPPSPPTVNVSQVEGSGLAVFCSPGTNGGLPTMYKITVEPGGINITTPSNGTTIQGLQSNTIYTVRVVAMNCAGSSEEHVVNASTGNDKLTFVNSAHTAIGVGVGVGVGVPLVVVISALVVMIVFMCYNHHSKSGYNLHITEVPTTSQPKSSVPNQIPKVDLCKLPKEIFPSCSEISNIVCTDAQLPNVLLEVTHETFVGVSKDNPLSHGSSDQQWYKKYLTAESFIIVSLSMKKALKCIPVDDPESGAINSQVVLHDVSEGDTFVVKDNHITCKDEAKGMYLDHNNLLYCCDKDDKACEKRGNTFEFQTVRFKIEDVENGSVISLNSNQKLISSHSNETGQYSQQLWHKLYPGGDSYDGSFLIASAMNNEQVITCAIEGDNEKVENYLWREDRGHIVSVKCGLVMAVEDCHESEASNQQINERESQLILSTEGQQRKHFKMTCR